MSVDAASLGRYGLGTAPLGIFPDLVDDGAAQRCLEHAYARGLRYFDTAPFYGAGLAERRLGAFLAGGAWPGLVLSTKVGRRVVPGTATRPATTVFDFGRDAVLRELEDSMRLLGRDRLDIVYIHDPDDHWAEAIDQTWPVLARLRDEGVIGAVGAGMNQVAMLSRFVRETTMDVVLLANRYTLLEQEAAGPLLAQCHERGVAVVLGGVFNSGILATGAVGGARYDYLPAPPPVRERVAAIAAVCRGHGVPLPAAALQFARAHPAVASVLIGARSAGEVEENVRHATRPIPSRLWAQLRERGLLRPDVPVPGAPPPDSDRCPVVSNDFP